MQHFCIKNVACNDTSAKRYIYKSWGSPLGCLRVISETFQCRLGFRHETLRLRGPRGSSKGRATPNKPSKLVLGFPIGKPNLQLLITLFQLLRILYSQLLTLST